MLVAGIGRGYFEANAPLGFFQIALFGLLVCAKLCCAVFPTGVGQRLKAKPDAGAAGSHVSQQAFPRKAGLCPEVNNAAGSQKRTGFLAAYKPLILSDISASLHCTAALLAPAG